MGFINRLLSFGEREQSASAAKRRLLEMMQEESQQWEITANQDEFREDLLNVIEHHLNLEKCAIEFELDQESGMLDIRIPLSTPSEARCQT